MDKICCHIDLFALQQKIYCGDDIVVVTTDRLAQTIEALCYGLNNYKVHVFGSNEYIQELITDIKTIENTHYGMNKIEIEVN